MRLLVVDDDAGVRRSVTLLLEDEGYDVLTASGGEEGLETAEKESPDIILCDVRMPEMDGLEFLDAYREDGGDALVIMITAYGSAELAVDAMKRGAYDYLPKPFSADEVLAAHVVHVLVPYQRLVPVDDFGYGFNNIADVLLLFAEPPAPVSVPAFSAWAWMVLVLLLGWIGLYRVIGYRA